MNNQNTYHLNDKTVKYKSLAEGKRLHNYLKLPGEFKTYYPNEVILPNMKSGRMDSLYSSTAKLLIHLEEETKKITKKTLKKFSKYMIFTGYMYVGKLYFAVICHEDPKKESECIKYSESQYFKIHYIHFPQEELQKKYENIINKVEQKEELSEREAMDIAFVAKFISKEKAANVVETLVTIFNDAIIPDEKLKIDVAVMLGGMVLKHIPSTSKQNRLMEILKMREYESEIQKIVYEEYGDEIDKVKENYEKTIQENKKTIQQNKKQMQQYKKQYRTGINEILKKEKLSNNAKEILENLLLL